MTLKKLNFRIPQEQAATLDSIAANRQCARSSLINEAVDQYLSLYEYHCALIDEGIRACDVGDVIDHSEVVKMVAGWSRDAKARSTADGKSLRL